MQMMKLSKSSAKIVWTYGIICGVFLCVLEFVSVHLVLSDDIGRIVGFIRLLILSMSFFYMGMLASKRTGQVRTGMQAGLVAGLTIGIFSSFLVGLNLASLFILAIALGGGATGGEMGGLIGYRWRKPLDDTTEADEESAIKSSRRTSL
jgi:uncharacterized YccA/Bax inhibitor family protein